MDDDQLSEDDVWRILKMNITQIINRPKTVDDSNRISLAASDTRQRFYTVLNDEQKGETKAVVSETPSAVAIVTSFMTRCGYFLIKYSVWFMLIKALNLPLPVL